ncbi:MAG: class I SAM-dependent methyltransferase [Anaerolineae bacterium]|nr:class I SAM-dependent methyltransferase [Anaerolineae bacterium]
MKAVLEIRHDEGATTRWSQGVYEEIYTSKEIRHIDSFYRWLLERLDPRPGRRLLDISCGVGSLPRLAAERGLQACGVDFSLQALRVARQEAPAVRLAVGDGERLPYPDASFDYITHIGSLEHYEHPLDGAREIARLLKPGGRACVLLPNTFGILGNIWHALRTGRTFDDGQPIQRYAARLEWQELLTAGGLQVVQTLGHEHAWPRSLADAGWYLRHLRPLLRMLLSPCIPLNWANYFVYLCRRAGDGS